MSSFISSNTVEQIPRFLHSHGEFSRHHGGFNKRLSGEAEATVLIIVQEAGSNTRKHTKAKNMWLNLAQQSEHLLIAVADDGRGFDLEAKWKARDQRSHLLLLGTLESADLIEAQPSVWSKLDQGTKMVVRVPLTACTDQYKSYRAGHPLPRLSTLS